MIYSARICRKGQPKVYGFWKEGCEINDQYDIWAQKKVYGIKNALIVCSISEEIPQNLSTNMKG